MFWTIIIILLLVWAIGGGAPLVRMGSGFGGNNIHFIWVIIIVLLVLALVRR